MPSRYRTTEMAHSNRFATVACALPACRGRPPAGRWHGGTESHGVSAPVPGNRPYRLQTGDVQKPAAGWAAGHPARPGDVENRRPPTQPTPPGRSKPYCHRPGVSRLPRGTIRPLVLKKKIKRKRRSRGSLGRHARLLASSGRAPARGNQTPQKTLEPYSPQPGKAG